MAAWTANTSTAGTHNLLVWALSCCGLYGFASFWLSVFSFTCPPSYVPTNTWFISQFNTTNRKEQSCFNTSGIFGRSQQSSPANLQAESLAQWRGSTIWTPVTMPLYVTSPLRNVFRTLAWPYYLCRYNCTTSHGCLETTRRLPRCRCKSLPHTLKENLCWPLAEHRSRLLGGDHGAQRYLSVKIKAFSFLCDKFTRICQFCNTLFVPQSLQEKTRTWLYIALLPVCDRQSSCEQPRVRKETPGKRLTQELSFVYQSVSKNTIFFS